MPRKPSPETQLLRHFEASSTPVYLLGADRTVIFANEALARWLGIGVAELMEHRVDYVALPVAQTASALSLQLCPPPEAFDGQSLVAPIASSTGELLSMRFLPLVDPNGDTSLLAIASPAIADEPAVVETASRLHAKLLELRQQWRRSATQHALLHLSGPQLREQVRLAASARRVVVSGPTGSGRRQTARAIHYGAQQNASLTSVDCRLVDVERLRTMLAAIVKRPVSQRGAVLLERVDLLKTEPQQWLAEWLRGAGADVVVRATSRWPLARLAARGKFRDDLAASLSTLTIELPPLRKRIADVPLLAQHFVEQHNASGGKQLSGFTPDALDQLAAYAWPGDVRELATVVAKCCERAKGPLIAPIDLPDELRQAAVASAHPSRLPQPIALDEFLADIERELLERALVATKGNKTKAATLLGVHRARLIRRLIHFGLAEPSAADEPVVFEPVPDQP